MPKKNAFDGEGTDVKQQTEGRRRSSDDAGRDDARRGDTGRANASRSVPSDDHEHGDGPDAGIDAISYEEARSRLVEIVVRLEQGSIPLEESLRLWEIGEQLARHCQDWLDGARERLAAARGVPEADGEPGRNSDSGPGGEPDGGQRESNGRQSAPRESDVEESDRRSGKEKK